ncbi:hypothetical protein ACIB24_02350 [Spongisporangium articulatum]|uniref:Allophanate hydrolase C-terminal domain-containing protein n=1 Tax=Spongisporangium articulatum TaxID=3362603 RepID=A0ABW8AHR7_9ACTN
MTAGPEHTALLAVCGAHLQGQPLHPVLESLGAVLVSLTRTAPVYRMVLLAAAGGDHDRPGLIRCPDGGASVEVELYRLPVAGLGALMVTVASPLAIGSVVLDDGSLVHGFVCEGFAEVGARDITSFGSWRNYLSRPVLT